MNPVIVKDTLNTNIPSGKIKFKGTITDNAGHTIVDYDINTINSRIQKIGIDNSGTFEILVDTTFTSITFSANNHMSVILSNQGFKNQHEITLNVSLQLNLIEPPHLDQEQIMTYKPVIYLYNEIDIDVNLSLKPSGEYTFTYPLIKDNQWHVKVTKDGLNHNGKLYPYLFYETENNDMNFSYSKEELIGHISEKNEIITYLEKSLTSLGLNQKEQTDFITFWAPRMVQHEEVFIQFWIDEDYDQVATLEVSPKPESIKRIYIVYAPITNNKPVYTEQTFKPFSRKGFTVIEWGGSELPSKKLQPKL
jgi:hypothetical protein